MDFKIRVCIKSQDTTIPPDVIAHRQTVLIHPRGCWGKAGEPFPTTGAAAPTPFHRSENVANLSKSPKNTDTPETIHSGGRTFVWKVAPGGAIIR